MSRNEAEAFLKRNPRVDIAKIQALAADGKLAQFWDFGAIDCEADALTDLISIAAAMEDNHA